MSSWRRAVMAFFRFEHVLAEAGRHAGVAGSRTAARDRNPGARHPVPAGPWSCSGRASSERTSDCRRAKAARMSRISQRSPVVACHKASRAPSRNNGSMSRVMRRASAAWRTLKASMRVRRVASCLRRISMVRSHSPDPPAPRQTGRKKAQADEQQAQPGRAREWAMGFHDCWIRASIASVHARQGSPPGYCRPALPRAAPRAHLTWRHTPISRLNSWRRRPTRSMNRRTGSIQ